jgi:hypothetical protein
MSNMYVVIQDQNGRVGHQSIGQALVEANLDASLTTLALRRKREPIVSFTVYSSKQAAEAIQELEELGDVDVDPRDFDAKWFDPSTASRPSIHYLSLGHAASRRVFARSSPCCGAC